MFSRFWWIILFIPCVASAQYDSLDVVQDGDFQNVDPLLIDIQKDHRRVVDLNKASYEVFAETRLFTEYQINQVLWYREYYNGFLEVDELKSLACFTSEYVDAIKRYFKVSKSEDLIYEYPSLTSVLIRSSINSNRDTSLLGDGFQHLIRIKHQSKIARMGLVFEKDKGELFYTKHGFSYLSSYLELSIPNKYFKNILIGDFNLAFGQGLLFGNTYNLGKTYATTQLASPRNDFLVHSSANEFFRLRGALTKFAYKKNEILVFGSIQKRSASVINEGEFGALKTDGIYTTANSLSQLNSLDENLFGFRLKHVFKNGLVGFNLIRVDYNGILNKNILSTNQFDFRGSGFTASSVDFARHKNKNSLQGEVSYYNHGFSYFIADQWSINRAHFLAHVRRYDRGNDFIFSNPLAERSSHKDELGFYFGFKLPVTKRMSYQSYIDVFVFDRQTNKYSALYGREWVHAIDFYVNESWQLGVRFKDEKYLGNSSKGRLRLQSSFEPNDYLSFKSTLEKVVVSDGNQKGYMFAQRVAIKRLPLRFKCHFGTVFYNTDSYDVSVYSYENDVRFAFTLPRFFDRGQRFYVVLAKRVGAKSTFSMKYGTTVSSVGQIKSDFRCQYFIEF